MRNREVNWLANKVLFEERIEALLSHCPNMGGEDDMRDICKAWCPLYIYYCVSIEPNSDCSEQTIQTDIVKSSQLGFEVPEKNEVSTKRVV